CVALWPWSQIHGLSANMVVPRLESAPRDDLNSDTPGVPPDLEPSRRDQEERHPARNPRAGLDRCLGEPLLWRPSRILQSDEPCASARCRGSPCAGGAVLLSLADVMGPGCCHVEGTTFGHGGSWWSPFFWSMDTLGLWPMVGFWRRR